MLVTEPHQREALVDASFQLLAPELPMQREREGHVLVHGGVLQQVELLEYHPQVLPGLAQFRCRELSQIAAVDQNLTTVWALKQIDHAQQCGLPGSATADQAKDFALRNAQRDGRDSRETPPVGEIEGLGDIGKPDERPGLRLEGG